MQAETPANLPNESRAVVTGEPPSTLQERVRQLQEMAHDNEQATLAEEPLDDVSDGDDLGDTPSTPETPAAKRAAAAKGDEDPEAEKPKKRLEGLEARAKAERDRVKGRRDASQEIAEARRVQAEARQQMQEVQQLRAQLQQQAAQFKALESGDPAAIKRLLDLASPDAVVDFIVTEGDPVRKAQREAERAAKAAMQQAPQADAKVAALEAKLQEFISEQSRTRNESAFKARIAEFADVEDGCPLAAAAFADPDLAGEVMARTYAIAERAAARGLAFNDDDLIVWLEKDLAKYAKLHASRQQAPTPAAPKATKQAPVEPEEDSDDDADAMADPPTRGGARTRPTNNGVPAFKSRVLNAKRLMAAASRR